MTEGTNGRQGLPVSTYRLQITAEHPLTEAASVVPYLTELGVDWAYLSPILRSEQGSDHGYDVVDHSRTDEPRGGRAGLQALADAAHHAGHGVLVDIVPNHVGVADPQPGSWWWDLLAKGRDSEHAEAFDVDWAAGGGRIRLPVLGDATGELDKLEVVDGELRYYDHRFPIAAGTLGGSPRQVHDRQHYELLDWHRADDDLNYRRFFAVSTLAGIRVEDRNVFDASHTEIKAWLDNGWIDGLRIDHPDGLADPGGYLDDLDGLGARYVLVEKILEGEEQLPESWKCYGTTGYDALAALDRLFVDPAGEAALDALDAELRGGARVDWPLMTTVTKRAVADGILHSEVLRLARLVPDIDRADDAIAELLANFSVYRTYLPLGREYLDEAVAAATRRRPALTETIAAVAGRLLDVGTEFSVRFQQTSGMVMAKGVEDNAFYRWTRLTSLTEVGADPAVFALSPTGFHSVQARRNSENPYTMTALTTHDTKRGEDVRARISVLSELPADWAEAVRRWNRRTGPADGPLSNLLWQATVGAWPLTRDRLQAYAVKAAKEAGTSTNWTAPDEVFEKSLRRMVDLAFDDPELNAEISAFADRISSPGWANSLSAKLFQILGPGVSDVYQGSELWENSLVDPDNRRPVDFDVRLALLRRIDAGWLPDIDPEGAAKLLVTSRALRLRRDLPELFTGYSPLSARGRAAGHLVAFDRGGVVAVGTRLSVSLAADGGWGDTTMELPSGVWRDQLLGGQSADLSESIQVATLLGRYPVAILVRQQ